MHKNLKLATLNKGNFSLNFVEGYSFIKQVNAHPQLVEGCNASLPCSVLFNQSKRRGLDVVPTLNSALWL